MTSDAGKIRDLNDRFRRGELDIGKIVMMGDLAQEAQSDPAKGYAVLSAVRAFNDFDEGNDPYEEHDFGTVEVNGESFVWKIDYYDPEMSGHSRDPADPEFTSRILTIVHSRDY